MADLAAALGQEPLDLMLRGGEDYVLLFALEPGIEPPENCFEIGTITEMRDGEERVELSANGARSALASRGFDHLK
jgi:thiamine monophosphate kinase